MSLSRKHFLKYCYEYSLLRDSVLGEVGAFVSAIRYQDGLKEQGRKEINRQDRRIRTEEGGIEKINISGNGIRFDGKWVRPPE